MRVDVSNKAIATILAAAIVVAAGIVVGLNMERFFGRGTAEPNASPAVSVPEIDPNAQDKRENLSADGIPAVAIPGWVKIELPADTTDVTTGIDFYNPDSNSGYFMLTYQLCLADSGEVLFQSGQISAGKHIQGITLNRSLEAGEYDAVLHVQPYSVQKPEQPLNNADIQLKLIVQ